MPIEGLNLQPGEWVEVKSIQSILETFNDVGVAGGCTFHRICAFGADGSVG